MGVVALGQRPHVQLVLVEGPRARQAEQSQPGRLVAGNGVVVDLVVVRADKQDAAAGRHDARCGPLRRKVGDVVVLDDVVVNLRPG